MLDVKGDKSLWEKMNIEGVGKVLLVEESYYNGIIEMIEQLKKENHMLDSAVDQDQQTKDRYADEINDLVNLNLWAARRLHKVHKEFAYDELEGITGQKFERL